MASQTLAAATDADDGHWAGAINTFGTTNGVVGGVSGTQYHWWTRWQLTASVAQNSIISSAAFTGRKIFAGQGTGWTVTAKFVDQASPSNPATVTDANNLWSAAASGSGNALSNADFPDGSDTFSLVVTNALQDLVNVRPLISGNYLMLILRSAGSSAFRRISPYENTPTPFPTLSFSYTEPSGSPWHYYAQQAIFR